MPTRRKPGPRRWQPVSKAFGRHCRDDHDGGRPSSSSRSFVGATWLRSSSRHRPKWPKQRRRTTLVAGLGDRFLLEAEAAFARIDEKPLTGPPWKHRRLPEGVRRMFIRSFPHSAVYIVEPRVIVVALARQGVP
jgi:hypothetical protein